MTAWIKAGDITKTVFFEAPPGLTTWTAYFAVDGGIPTAVTTPTVTERSAANMPGLYSIDIDQTNMVTKEAASSPTEQVALFISATGWPGKVVTYVIYDNLPADNNQILGNDVSEGAGDNNRGVGY